MIGQIINGYTIVRKLGEGGMADVYYAKNSLGKEAAVKILKDDVAKNNSIKKRFKLEAQIMMKLDGIDGICKVFDRTELEDGKIAIIMEYLDGMNLKEWVIKKGKITDTGTIKKICNQVLTSLGEAHKRGIVHRDIKPSNLFRLKDGRIKIMDFGISKLLFGDDINTTVTDTTVSKSIGTYEYMSPEQILCNPNIDYRTDIYSFGLTVYYLITGKSPATLSDKSLSCHIQDGIIMKLVQKSTERDLEDRAKSCEELIGIITNDTNFTRIFEEGLKWYNGTDGYCVDLEKAFGCFKRAAESGLGEAQHYLGRCYIDGIGTDVDNKEGVKWLKSAVKLSVDDARFSLAVCYQEGIGVEVNDAEAVGLLRKAAERKHSDALCMLGVCYRDGRGVAQNTTEAVKYFRLAAEQEHVIAQYLMGMCYIEGTGVVQNNQEAAKWLELSEQQGDDDAQVMLGLLKLTGNGIKKDVTQAANLFQKSADKGNVRGMYYLGVCYLNGEGVEKDLFRAKKCFHLAAEQGDSDAQCSLGCCYYNGNGAVLDYTEAAKWFEASADHGDPDAMNNLGMCYEEGKGVTKNKETALKYYRQASELGHEVATENYNRLSKDDGCYITTAICQYYNKPDNCYELTRLRWFRDNWLQYQEQGKALIDEYYKTAPSMVAVINRDAEKDKVYGVLNGYISRCISFIEEEKYDRTQQEYMAMINYLQMRYR